MRHARSSSSRGHAPNERAAAATIADHLGLAALAEPALAALLAKVRDVAGPDLAQAFKRAELWPFAFSQSGCALELTPKTPRPWAHLLANHLGQGAVVSNEGEIHSFAGNERQNALTPFNFESVPASIPGQLIYVVDLETGETDTAGYVPFRRADARYEVTYELGSAQFRCIRDNVQLELTIFVPPEEQADIRLLSLRNPTDRAKRYRVVPYFEIVLDENGQASRGRIQAARDEETGTLLYTNPTNDFPQGLGFRRDEPDRRFDRSDASRASSRQRPRSRQSHHGRDRHARSVLPGRWQPRRRLCQHC